MEVKKINEIYDSLANFLQVGEGLPKVISRLETLKAIHNQSAGIKENLQNLSTSETQNANLLQLNSEKLQTFSKKFKSEFKETYTMMVKLEKSILSKLI